METNEKPLVSIITLAYNSQFLKETVDSLLSQDYPHIQYIISDDGTDSFDCDYWRNYVLENNKGNIDDLIVVSLDEHEGTVRNYNNALRLVKGEYIFPLSSDDTFCSSTSLSQWTVAFTRCNAKVMGARCDLYDVSMTEYIGTWPNAIDTKLLECGSIEKIYEKLEYKKIIPGCNLARTRASIAELGFFDEKYVLLEDYPFLMQTLRKGERIGFANLAVIRHRKGGVSDYANMDPILKRDMELLYSEDIYPFSKDPVKLTKFRADELEKAAILSTWHTMSFSQRTLSAIRHPICVMKLVFKRLLRLF